MIRLKFLRFLTYRIAKVDEGAIPPKWIMIIHNILFPLRYLYARNSNIRYDVHTDTYIIRGTKFSGQFFDHFGRESSLNQKFEIIKRDKDGSVVINSYQK